MTIYDKMNINFENAIQDTEILITQIIPKENPIQTENLIEQIAELYSLIKDKDLFLHHYWVFF